MITVQRLLEELGNKAWSGFNKDDMFYSNEDAQTAITELNGANRYLMALEDFPFKDKETQILTKIEKSNYNCPIGQIKFIYNHETNTFLDLIEGDDILQLEDLNGIPSKFYFKYDNPNAPEIVLYPTPNDTIKLTIKYNDLNFILNAQGEPVAEFTSADDVLNLPKHIEHYYMDALILRTIAQNNKDISDENYQPTLKEFAEVWQNFVKLSQPVQKDLYISI